MYDTWGLVAKKPKGSWRPFTKHTRTNCAAAAVGQLQPCVLGKDKTKRYTKWTNWRKEAKTKMSYLAITSWLT